jgi:4-amino-4-deoxy-L-arabinose transferase-like glycosyltransferase
VAFSTGLLFAILAQCVSNCWRDLVWAGIATHIVALALIVAGVWGRRRLPLPRLAWRPFLLVGVAGLVAWAAYLAHACNRYEYAVLLWILGLALAAVVLSGRLRRWKLPKWWRQEVVAIALLFAVALALRIIKLGQIPDLMSGDEGSMALDAERILNGHPANPFGTGWLSHPNLFFYMEAAALRVFGRNLFGLRFTAAVLGALGVPAVYLLGKGVFGRQVAWIGAFFLAGWGLPLQLSRLALNNSADPFFGALVLAFLQRGLVRGRRGYFVAAGLALGAGLYFYHGTRLLVLLALVVLAFSGWRRAWRCRRGLLAFAVAALLVAGPLLVHFVKIPSSFTERYEVLGSLRSMQMEGERADTGKSMGWLWLVHLERSIFAFVYVRDRGFFYMADTPMLCVLSGTLFVLGVGLALLHWREVRYAVLLVWLGLTVVLGGWALEFPPQYQRYLIASPAVCLLVGRAAVTLLRLARRIWDWRPAVCQHLVVLTAVVLLALSAGYYFGIYTPAGGFGDRNTEIADRTARLMAAVGPDYATYFLGMSYMPLGGFNSVRFLAPGADWVQVDESPPTDWSFVREGRGALFVVMEERSDDLPVLYDRFPGGEKWQIEGRKGGVLFSVYQVDAANVHLPTDVPPSAEGEGSR